MLHSNIIELSGFYFRKKKDLKEDTAAKKNCKLSSGYYDAVHLKFSYLHFTFFSFLVEDRSIAVLKLRISMNF